MLRCKVLSHYSNAFSDLRNVIELIITRNKKLEKPVLRLRKFDLGGRLPTNMGKELHQKAHGKCAIYSSPGKPFQ